jgi:hypothetical protein
VSKSTISGLWNIFQTSQQSWEALNKERSCGSLVRELIIIIILEMGLYYVAQGFSQVCNPLASAS